MSFDKRFSSNSKSDAEKATKGVTQMTLNETNKTENGLKSKQNNSDMDSDHFFQDGIRKIDFVLVYKGWNDTRKKSKEQIRRENHRQQFLENLQKAGLEIEEQHHIILVDYFFVKIHIPWDRLLQYAEIFKIKLPIEENEIEDMRLPCKPVCIKYYRECELPKINHYFRSVLSIQEMHALSITEKETDKYFSDAHRSLLVDFVLSMTIYNPPQFGIDGLLASGVFLEAYPLHSGDPKYDDSPTNLRGQLYSTWTSIRNWNRTQPYDHINLYFGEKIAIYFYWIGFYTKMLMPLAIIGIILSLVSVIYVKTTKSGFRKEICDEHGLGNLIMCPECDTFCKYRRLSEYCSDTNINAIFDNPASIFFSIATAIWSVLFLKLWKRREAKAQFKWHVYDFKELEQVRPEFENADLEKRPSPISGIMEPYLRWQDKMQRYTLSVLVVLIFTCAALLCTLGYILFGIWAVPTIKTRYPAGYPNVLATLASTCISVPTMLALDYLYYHVAIKLTDYELPRTQSQWESSFIAKLFPFKFINYNAYLLYIALFKHKFTGFPKEYKRFQGYRFPECGPTGCFKDLFFALITQYALMLALNNAIELGYAIFCNTIRNCYLCLQRFKLKGNQQHLGQMEKDYAHTAFPRFALLDEYLEVVMQYVYITMYASVFPIGPFLAWLNNILEIRIDAFKFVTQYQRPVARRAQDIGIWYNIIKAVTIISIVVNAAIIVFTSQFVERVVFNLLDRSSFTMFVLSEFNVSHFDARARPQTPGFNGQTIGICYYNHFRQPPVVGIPAEQQYSLTKDFWMVLAARCIFFIGYILTIGILSWLILLLIPGTPRQAMLHIKREKHLAMQLKVDIGNEFAMEAKRKEQAKRSLWGPKTDNSSNIEIPSGTVHLPTEELTKSSD